MLKISVTHFYPKMHLIFTILRIYLVYLKVNYYLLSQNSATVTSSNN